MKKKILVTGSTGFIGDHLTKKLLQEKYIVFAVVREKNANKKKINKIKKEYKNYRPIFFQNLKQLGNKLTKVNTNIVINLATKYLNKHDFSQMIELINSNILFTTAVLEALPKKSIKKYINLSTMIIHGNSKEYHPINLYASTKKGFADILKFYQINFRNIKFYNVSMYDTYGLNDKRKKMIPVIIKNYFSNKKTTVVSKKLKMNLLNVKDVCEGIKIIVKKNIPEGNYLMKSKRFTNILGLIQDTNKKLDKKIKFKLLNKKIDKIINKKIKKIPFWKQSTTIEKDLVKYLYENS